MNEDKLNNIKDSLKDSFNNSLIAFNKKEQDPSEENIIDWVNSRDEYLQDLEDLIKFINRNFN